MELGTLLSFLAAMFIAVGALCGWGYTEQSWRTDCDKIGKHVSHSGKVYACSQEPEKK